MVKPHDMTALLQAWAEGDEGARDELMPLVYEDLRRIAENRMRREKNLLTIETTGLVHEAYLRLVDQARARWQNRGHFFSIAARVMRRILVERHRARHAQKRGDPDARIAIEDVDVPAGGAPLDLELLGHALDRLEQQDPDQARIVELRFFAGLTIEETADAVGVSPATVKREWTLARTWL